MGSDAFSTLSDVADVIDSLHKTPKYSEFGYPMVRCVNISYGPLNLSETKLVTEEIFKEYSKKYTPQSGDIIITRVGANFGETTYVEDTNFCLGQNTAAIKPKAINSDYLYFMLNSAHCKHQMDVLAAGAAQPTLSIKSIKSIKIPRLGDESEQNIAYIIGGLNNKITLNRQINQTLEQMAQALFKSWFVDFDPVVDNALDAGFFAQDLDLPDELLRRAEARQAVRKQSDFKPLPDATRQLFPAVFEECAEPSLGLGGWVPKGWKTKMLGDITSELRRGISPKYIEDGGVKVINQKCIRNHELSYEAARRHDQETKAINGRSLQLGDVLVNSTGVGTLGRIAQVTYLDETTVADSHVTVVRVKEDIFPIYTFGQLMLSMESNIERLGEGSTGQTELSRKILSEQLVVLPPSIIAEHVNKSFKSFAEKQVSNRKQNSELTKLRDTLLPKLISGELRLDNIKVELVTDAVN